MKKTLKRLISFAALISLLSTAGCGGENQVIRQRAPLGRVLLLIWANHSRVVK